MGSLIEREVDELWFTARILSVNKRDGCYDLIYLDDGNSEADVPAMETRPVQDPEGLPLEPVRTRILPTPPVFLPFRELLSTEDDEAPECTPRIIRHAPGLVDEEGRPSRTFLS